VGTYPLHWAAISGGIEQPEPLQQAYTEIAEETGLSVGQVELVGTGMPVRVPDWASGTLWVVHPFLFRCKAPEAVRRDWEHLRFQWTERGQMTALKTVPGLADAYHSARRAAHRGGSYDSGAIFRMISEDRQHGAEELGLWTLEALKAVLAESAEGRAAGDEAKSPAQGCMQACGIPAAEHGPAADRIPGGVGDPQGGIGWLQ